MSEEFAIMLDHNISGVFFEPTGNNHSLTFGIKDGYAMEQAHPNEFILSNPLVKFKIKGCAVNCEDKNIIINYSKDYDKNDQHFYLNHPENPCAKKGPCAKAIISFKN